MTGGGASAQRESRRGAAGRKKAARVRDGPTLNQAMACIHREKWLKAMLYELSCLSTVYLSSLSCPQGIVHVCGFEEF